jgi:hypothetical protein
LILVKDWKQILGWRKNLFLTLLHSLSKSVDRGALKANGNIYRFVNFSFNSNEGSLYIYFVGMPKTSEKAEQGAYNFTEQIWKEPLSKVEEDSIENPKLSYHTSGQINLHLYSRLRCFGEPIYRISKENFFLNYYIPNIELLPVYNNKIAENDYLYEVECVGEKLFSFVICPSSITIKNPDNVEYIAIYIQELFNLLIFNNKPLLEDVKIPRKDKQVLLFPELNLFKELQVAPSDALIEFYKKTRNLEGGVVEGPNNEGIYRLIFPSSDLVRRYKILLEDQSIETEIIYFKEGYSVSRFCLKDKDGNRIKKKILCNKVQFF